MESSLEGNVINEDNLGVLLEEAVIFKATDRSIDYYEKVLDLKLSSYERETTERFYDWITLKKVLMISKSISWRYTNNKIVRDVEVAVPYILENCGYGIMNGGAIGGDFVSNEIALRELVKNERDPGKHLAIVLPTPRGVFYERLTNVALQEDDFIRTAADSLIKQLQNIDKNWPEAIFDDYADGHINETRFLDSNDLDYRKSVYHDRNGLIAFGCDASIGLRVNDSMGVEDTQKKVRLLGKPTLTQRYKIDPSSAFGDYTKADITGKDALGIPYRSYETSS